MSYYEINDPILHLFEVIERLRYTKHGTVGTYGKIVIVALGTMNERVALTANGTPME